MKTKAMFVVTLVMLLNLCSAPAAERVVISNTTEKITACGLGYDMPNPVLEIMDRQNTRYSYPYPIHNIHVRDRRAIQIELVTLENEFIRVSFSPDFGGRIWSMVDKKSGEEMFFHNNSFKTYYSGACGGAYMGAGVELNYPQAHSITNIMPRKVKAVQNEDGSATVTISEWERVYRTQWQVSFTLKPGEARLLQRVILYNRSHLPGRYRYWCNASCPVSDDFQFIYPEKNASEHGGDSVITWPNYRDNDWSYYRNIYDIVGLYFLEPKDDFFGYYDYGRNFGVVHQGDRHKVPGKKVWSWGKTLYQQMRINSLSEGLGPYGEFQSGRPINQDHFEFIMPQEIIHWNEVWYPVKNLGHFMQATDQFAVAIENKGASKAILKIFANCPVSGITAQIDVKNKTIAQIPIRLSTQGLLEKDIVFDGADFNDISVTFLDSRGSAFEDVSVKGRGTYKKPSEVRQEPILDNRSSYSLYMSGSFHDRLGETDKAEKLYRESMALDKHNPEPMRNLGAMLLSRGRTKEARKLLTQALECNKWDGLARYYLAYANLLDGDIDSAYDEAAWSSGMYLESMNGNLLAVETLGKKGLFEEAVSYLDKASEHGVLQVKIPAMKSAFLRNLNKTPEALREIKSAKEKGIEDILIHFEKFFLNTGVDENDAVALADELHRDPYRFIEAAIDYMSLGLYGDAEKVCTIGIGLDTYLSRDLFHFHPDAVLSKFKKKSVNPFLYLLRGYARKHRNASLDMVKEDYAIADRVEYYVFVNQPEIELILRDAIDTINSKGALEYYLGTYLTHKKRYDEALETLHKAEKKGLVFDVLYRNIAVIYWKYKDNLVSAKEYYKKAIKSAPDDIYIYLELARLYEGKERLELLLSTPGKFTRIYPGMTSLVLNAIAETGDIEGYRNFIQKVELYNWQGDGRKAYLLSRLKLARVLYDKGDYAAAYEQLNLADKYPKQFGTGVLPARWDFLERIECLKGFCLKKMSKEKEAVVCFEKASSRKHKPSFREVSRSVVNKARFYQALALKELGREAEAESYLDGINYYRQLNKLIPLRFRIEDEDLLDTAEPDE